MSEKSPSTYRRRLAVTSALAVASITAGKPVYDGISDNRANSAQPVCDIKAQSGDTVSGIMTRLRTNGDNVRAERVKVVAPDGHVRNPHDDPTYWRAGSMALQGGDVVKINNVDRNVCVVSGGVESTGLNPTPKNEPIPTQSSNS